MTAELPPVAGTTPEDGPRARRIARLVHRGEIGGRTVLIDRGGVVDCETYGIGPLAPGSVRVRTRVSAISPGTEMTFLGPDATNPYLHKRWDEELRLFVGGRATITYPFFFGYRASGEIVESAEADLPIGTRLFGNWRHTEYRSLPARVARLRRLPDGLSWDDGVDVAQLGPICVNAVAHAEGQHEGTPVVVFGAGLVGLVTAQVARSTGAGSVIVVDRVGFRLAVARKLGFETTDASEVADVAVEIKRALGPDSIAVAFECTGASAALNEAVRVVRRQGTVVALGFYQGGASSLLLGEEFHHNGVRIHCGQIGNIHSAWDWAGLRRRTLQLALSGQLTLGGLPRLELPVDQVAEGFAALKRPNEVLQVQLAYR